MLVQAAEDDAAAAAAKRARTRQACLATLSLSLSEPPSYSSSSSSCGRETSYSERARESRAETILGTSTRYTVYALYVLYCLWSAPAAAAVGHCVIALPHTRQAPINAAPPLCERSLEHSCCTLVMCIFFSARVAQPINTSQTIASWRNCATKLLGSASALFRL